MSTRTIEERLREALASRAEEITEDHLRAPVVPAVTPRRITWLLPMTVAAAVATALTVPTLPTLHPTAEAPLAQPSVTDEPEVAPLGPPMAFEHGPAPAARASSAAPPPAAAMPTEGVSRGPTVSYGGVHLEIPASWTLQDVETDPGYACVWVRAADRCEFTVVTAEAGGYHVLHADDPRQVAMQLPECADAQSVRLLASETMDLAGRGDGQYRRYELTCGTKSTEFEQWTVGTAPAVKIHRERVDPATEPQVLTAVESLRIDKPDTGRLISDFGFIVGYRSTAAGVELRLDRATPTWRPGGGWDAGNINTRTYDYPVAPDGVGLTSSLCGSGPSVLGVCELDGLLDRIDQGAAPADGGPPVSAVPVWLGLDEDGRVSSIAA